MKGFRTLNQAVKTPEIDPQAAPISKHNGIETQAGQEKWMLINEKQTAINPNTLPTERSILPVRMTRVMPQARIPYTDAWRRVSRCVPVFKRAIRVENHP